MLAALQRGRGLPPGEDHRLNTGAEDRRHQTGGVLRGGRPRRRGRSTGGRDRARSRGRGAVMSRGRGVATKEGRGQGTTAVMTGEEARRSLLRRGTTFPATSLFLNL